MAASQSRTVHSKTHRVCPVHTINIGPIGPLSSTIPSPWIESLPKAGLVCHARFKELLYQENGCVPITYGTFQDPQGLSCPHKKYWTHRSIIQYYTITLNWVLTQGRSHMPCAIQRANVPGQWLRPNHEWYIPRPSRSVLSTQDILDPSVHYPVLYHHLESSPFPKAGLICHARYKELLY